MHLKVVSAAVIAGIILHVTSGCAETRLYEKDKQTGQLRLVCCIQSDATNVTVKTKQTYFHADILNNSNPTTAGGTSAQRIISSGGAVVVSGITRSPFPIISERAAEAIHR
jgi:hypothetical protein